MLEILSNEGIELKDVFVDRSFAHENKLTRKPNIGTFTKYLNGYYDLANSFVIGDRLTDVQLAKKFGREGDFYKKLRCAA
jgi:imidazoleglycerol-phosphate dehydratase/histidinol-phosphatase